jgi:hypothetical protein
MRGYVSVWTHLILVCDRAFFTSLEHLNWTRRHDRRNRMLVDQLRMAIAPQKKAKIIEPGHKSLQFNAVYQENGYRRFGFANVIEERILKVLRFFARHELIPVGFGPPRTAVASSRVAGAPRCIAPPLAVSN